MTSADSSVFNFFDLNEIKIVHHESKINSPCLKNLLVAVQVLVEVEVSSLPLAAAERV